MLSTAEDQRKLGHMPTVLGSPAHPKCMPQAGFRLARTVLCKLCSRQHEYKLLTLALHAANCICAIPRLCAHTFPADNLSQTHSPWEDLEKMSGSMPLILPDPQTRETIPPHGHHPEHSRKTWRPLSPTFFFFFLRACIAIKRQVVRAARERGVCLEGAAATVQAGDGSKMGANRWPFPLRIEWAPTHFFFAKSKPNSSSSTSPSGGGCSFAPAPPAASSSSFNRPGQAAR